MFLKMVDPQVAMGLNTTVCSDLDDLEYQNDGMLPIRDLSSFETIPNILPVAGNHEKNPRKPTPSRDLFAPRDFPPDHGSPAEFAGAARTLTASEFG